MTMNTDNGNPDLFHWFTLMLASALVSITVGYLVFVNLRPRIPEEV